MVRAHLFISGAVQGVGYRWNCRREAGALGLAGWVRNLDDGRVEAVLQGPKEVVEKMVAWCFRGPRGAQVADVAVTYEEPADDLLGFDVR